MNRREFLQTSTLTAASIVLMPGFASASAFASRDFFQDGDTVMFLGDSITHNGKWHTFVRNYYLTRFPERNIKFINSGISGDSTGTVLQRMDNDILLHKPTVVVIMLGMNNSGTQIYLENRGPEYVVQQRELLCKTYRDEMRQIVENLEAHSKPRFIFVSPTIYDQTAKIDQVPAIGKNDTLARLTEIAKQLAKEKQSLFVDMFHPMMMLNAAQQLKDPSYTIIGKDRVHPGNAGHQLMAYYFLKAQRVGSIVSEIEMNWRKPDHYKITNATISDVSKRDGVLTFKCKENALPYPVGEDSYEVFRWVQFSYELNRGLIKCRGLSPGNYSLEIDGTIVGTYTNIQLANGVGHFAENQKTPQYRQSQALYQKSLELTTKVAMKRSLFQVRKMMLNDKVDNSNAADVKAYAEKMNKINIYFGRIINEYIQYGTNEAALDKEIESLTNLLNIMRKIPTRQYQIKAV